MWTCIPPVHAIWVLTDGTTDWWSPGQTCEWEQISHLLFSPNSVPPFTIHVAVVTPSLARWDMQDSLSAVNREEGLHRLRGASANFWPWLIASHLRGRVMVGLSERIIPGAA